jgi:hypothetical protein
VSPPQGQPPRRIEDKDQCESLEDTRPGLDPAIAVPLRGNAESQEQACVANLGKPFATESTEGAEMRNTDFRGVPVDTPDMPC